MDKKILIVEDSEDDLLIIKRFLNKSGYNNLTTADNAEDGIKKAIEEKPDLIITDTILPGNNGFEVCRKIREAGLKSSHKIIIQTGSIDAVDAVRAKEVGANDYCAKTSDCGPLLEAISKLIG